VNGHDVRNLVNAVSRDWKSRLTWQVVDPNTASVQDLLQAPIVFLNGHEAPQFTEEGKKNLRAHVEQGGTSSPRRAAHASVSTRGSAP
jgi:hypothetical protein